MMLTGSLASLFLTLLTAFSSYAQKPGYTVCTATVNSPEERESFKKHLSGQNFNFVELTDYSEAESKEDRDSNWFKRACEAGVKCDVLVISGHFGGNFFGESGFSLETDMLEEHSCQNSCDGILKQPKEVFLFGCNTLATKEKDHRTPEEYLRVLVQDGIERDDAERIVQARYGALGDSYKERMQRIFSGVKHIYGFDSVGPSGKTVKPFLDKYFQRMPDYENHLLKMDTEDLVSLIETANHAVKDLNNSVLADVLKDTAFAQCSGIAEDDPAYRFKSEICKLYDSEKTHVEKIAVVESMLRSENSLMFFPSVSAYLKENHNLIMEDPGARAALNKIAMDPQVKEQMDTLLKSLEGSPGLQVDVLHVQWVLGWMNKEQFDARVKLAFKDRLKNLNRESVDLLCSLREHDLTNLRVTLEDFNPAQLRTPMGAVAFNCMKTDDPRITKEILKAFTKAGREYNFAMLFAASELPGYNAELTKIARKFAKSKDEGEREAANRLILYKGEPQERRESVKALLGDTQGQWTAADYMRESGHRDDAIGREALARLAADPKEEDIWPLTQVLAYGLEDKSPVWQELSQKLGTKNSAVNSAVGMELAYRNPDNPHLTNWALANILESDGHQFADILAHSTLNRTQANTMLSYIRKNPREYKSGYFRWALQNQKGLALTPEEKNLLEGPVHKYECKQTGPNSWGCSGD